MLRTRGGAVVPAKFATAGVADVAHGRRRTGAREVRHALAGRNEAPGRGEAAPVRHAPQPVKRKAPPGEEPDGAKTFRRTQRVLSHPPR